MTIIQSSEANKVQASASTTVWEYFMDDAVVSGAVAEINGRYPEKGFAINSVSKELAFVISGHGHVLSPKAQHTITIGDVIFLDKGERFAWQGTVTIFMVTTPKFDPKQHSVKHIP
ncbi:hypothetical protein HY339_02535 [Candidatus Gottesmanbacteria bacterium]|nr:hypothetical protein [Candidatus Gottesmanbacteria bacterium]